MEPVLLEEQMAHNRECPRCGQRQAMLTDKRGLDVALAHYHSTKGYPLVEVCMCTDSRQLSIMWNNIYRRIRKHKNLDQFLVCPDCAFWQTMD